MATYGTFNDGFTLTAAEANDIGVWTEVTPVIRQPGSIAISVGSSVMSYSKNNKLVYVQAKIAVNAAGTANTRIEVDMPITAATGSLQVIGDGWFSDASVDQYLLRVIQYSTTRFAFFTADATSETMYLGLTGGPGPALAANDLLYFRAVYEAA